MIKLKNIFTIAIAVMMLGSALVSVGTALADPAVVGSGTSAAACDVNDPLCLKPAATTGLGNQDIRVTIASIIKTAMGLLGIVAVVIILIGGFTWMTAGGNDEKVGQAKSWIFAGVIGLAIILSAYALATYVINSLLTATSNSMVTPT